MSNTDNSPSVYELMDRVRAHPDFVFGAIFTQDDFEDGVPEGFLDHAEDRLVEHGNEIIWDMTI